MSAFCVFGMTRPLADRLARAAADKRTLTAGERRAMTQADWEAWISEKAEEILGGGRVRLVSGMFDAPQFAEDWIRLAKATAGAKRCRIMVRSEKVDKHGKPVLNKKTGRPVMTWSPYPASRAAS